MWKNHISQGNGRSGSPHSWAISRSTVKRPEAARRARAYGYVFQAAGLYPWRTIGGNIALPLEVMGYDKAAQAARVRHVLDLVELDGFEKKFPWQLSGGMQQRASIARALAFDADLLLMDEPFGALDEIVRDHLNEQLLQLWMRTNKTICFVTHSIPEAVYLSTKIVVMSPRPGRITDVIDSPLPKERPLEIRDSAQFIEIATSGACGTACLGMEIWHDPAYYGTRLRQC